MLKIIVHFLNFRAIFCVYLWNYWEFFLADFFSRKNVKKKNYLKHLLYSQKRNAKITFNKKNPVLPSVFWLYFQNYIEFYNSDCFSWDNVKNSMKKSIFVWYKQIFTDKTNAFPITLTNRRCPNCQDGIPFPP